MYLTYEEYQNMGGTLDETAFNDFEFEAECIVNWYTFDRLKTENPENYPPELPRLMIALIRLGKLKRDSMLLGAQTTSTSSGGQTVTVTTNPVIASQSNDGVSVSYNSVSASEVFNKLSVFTRGGEIEALVKTYLQGVKNSLGKRLLYRGIYPDE